LPDQHKNFAYSLVSTAPSPATSGTSLVVTAADGAKFPAVPFNVTIWPTSVQSSTTNAEIARCTAVSTDTLTITRAQEGSSARTVVIGDQIAVTVTSKVLTDAETIGEILRVPADDVYLDANCSAVPLEEYVMDATHELVFGDLSEMAVLL
jgi:hypothetical protein